jgi:hypothetical protein
MAQYLNVKYAIMIGRLGENQNYLSGYNFDNMVIRVTLRVSVGFRNSEKPSLSSLNLSLEL